MRMCKPSFATTETPLPAQGAMGVGSTAVALATSPLLTLPQSFGDIYLGETLSAYVSTCNQAPYPLGAVQLKVEVQTSSQRQLLLSRAGDAPAGGLAPAGRADCIVRYELREVGVHILICSAAFVDADGESRNLRKFFKFQVQNPLSMKSKSHPLGVGTAAEAVLVETQVQNCTASPLNLTAVRFVTAGAIAVDDLNSFVQRADQLACLKPGDVQQYMYRLRAAPGAPADALRAASALGRMDVRWRGPMAEVGHLQSNMVQRRQPPARAVELRVLGLESSEPIPALALVDVSAGAGEPLVALREVPFRMRARVRNCTAAQQLALRLFWTARAPSGAAPPKPPPSEPHPPLVFTGVSGADVGVLEPGGSADIALDFVAIAPGLHRLAGLALQDQRTGVTFDLGVIGEVLVLDGARGGEPAGWR